MGVIDKKTVGMSCVACEATEQTAAVQNGSNWAFGSWSNFDMPVHFELKVSHEGGEPSVESAICKHCGIAAIITERYCP